MEKIQCLKRIMSNFPEKYSEELGEQFIEYLERLGLGPIQTEVFCNTILENYSHQHRYFPTMKEISEIWGNRSGSREFSNRDFSQYQVDDCIQKTKHYSIDKIIKGCIDIMNGGKCQHKECQDKPGPCTTQLMFLRTWGELASIKGHLIDLKWTDLQIDEYLKKVKNTIIAGEKPNFDIVYQERKMNIDNDRKSKSYDDEMYQVGELF